MERVFFLIFLSLANSDFLAAKMLQGSELVVKRGYEAALKIEHLGRVPNDSVVCRIEIVPDPICLRFGNITSNRFYCDFGGIRPTFYRHSGSVISDTDCIKMKLLLFYEDRTTIEIIKVKVAVQNRPKEEELANPVITVNKIGGKVSFGRDILPSSMRKYQDSCTIQIVASHGDWPAKGKVIKHSSTREKPRCSTLNATYRHDGSYIPNVDYIALVLAWKNESGYFTIRYQVKVKIEGAQKNDPPLLYSRRPRLIVKQYSITQIKASSLRAIDYRTDPSKLLLRISLPGSYNSDGYFSSVDDPGTPIEGITQEMIDKGRLLFVAPQNYKMKRRRPLIVLQFQIQALDQYGAVSSKNLRMVFFIRKFTAHYLSVVKNNPLRVLEGRSCKLGTGSIDILCPASKCSRAKFSVVGEPKHGSLLIEKEKINQFMYQDLKSGNILYKHDNSESIFDTIVISLMERSQLAIATLNVIVEPIDDSPPFLSVHKDLVVRHGKLTKIDIRVLRASDPDSSTNDILFRIVVMPKGGNLKRYDNGRFIPVREFSEVDLEQGSIYYNAFEKGHTRDSFVFILTDRKPNLSKRYTAQIKILATDTIPPRKRHGGECLARMNETDALIPLNFIDYIDDVSPSSDISVKLMPHKQHDYRYVRLNDIVRKVGYNYFPTTIFTQQELFHSKILYLNNEKEVGVHAKSLRLDFVVSDGANNTTPTESCTIIIHPVDNKAPVISILGTIKALEGGRVCMNASAIEVTDVDTALTRVKLRLKSTPRHGRIVYKGKNMSESESIDYLEFRHRCLWYYHDDSETKWDTFTISASDGVNNGQHEVKIVIEPVNDLRPYFLEKSTKIRVMENSSVVLDSNVLEALDKDSDKSTFEFHIIKLPKLGYMSKKTTTVKKFTQSDIDNELLVYGHKNTEIGPYSVYDNFTVVVCDLPQLPDECNSVIHIIVEIIPINSSPPTLISGAELIVNEGGSSVLGVYELSCKDRDTLSGKIIIRVVKFPGFGFLENVAPSAGSEQSNAGLHISEFLCSDLDKGSINYVQNNHTGFEPLSDSFEVIAFDGTFNSTSVSIKIQIRPTSDERPVLMQIAPIKVQEGGWVLITKNHISIEDKDIPKDILKMYITNTPKHGLIFYKCNGVGSPRLQRLKVNAPVDYRRCALIYVHDDSETLSDKIHIKATDGKMASRSTIKVDVIPVNDERPQIVKNIAMTVRFGGFKNITRSYLFAQDLDTQAGQLRYRITKLPFYGSLKLYSNGIAIRMVLNSTFTQDDIDKKRLSYINHIMPVSGLADSIHFSLNDGVHFIRNQTFTIRIRLSCRKYFSVETKDVQSNGAKIYITSSNLRAQRRKIGRRNMAKNIVFHIIRQPKHGVLSFDVTGKGGKVTTLTENDLKERRLVYRSFEYPRKKNDSFRFFATDGKCMQRGKLHILTIDRNITVHLMKRVSPLNIIERGVFSITSLEIRALDKFNSDKVIYRIKNLPKHGTILKDGVNALNFTQQDINELRISYLLTNVRAKDDEVQIAVLVKDFYGTGLDSKPKTFPFKININIPNIGSVRVITNEPITALERVDRSSIGTVITKRNLLSYDCTSSPDSNLTYTVAEPPVHGELIFKGSGRRAAKFTQDDVNSERVIYKLTDHAHTDYSDSLILDLESEGCHKLLGVEFTIKWSIVSISENITIKCAGGETSIAIRLTRKGYINQGSVVEIHTKSATDNEETLLPSRIWFHPGDKNKTWKMPEDALEYEKVEIYLSKEFNTLLGKSRIIFDIAKSQDACSLEREKNQQSFANVKVESSPKAHPGKTDPYHAIVPVKTSPDLGLNGQASAYLDLKSDNRRYAACSKGWIGFQDNCYFSSNKTTNWKKAKKFCKKKNASLYTPSSLLEDTVVRKIRKGRAIWLVSAKGAPKFSRIYIVKKFFILWYQNENSFVRTCGHLTNSDAVITLCKARFIGNEAVALAKNLGIRVGKRKNWKWNVRRMRQPFLRKLQKLESQKTSKNLCIYADARNEWKVHSCKDKAIATYMCKKQRKYDKM